MNNQRKWEVLKKLKVKTQKLEVEDIVNILLKNRGIKSSKEKEEFFYPRHPKDLTLKELGISKREVAKGIRRIEKALKNDETIIIYGDYDVDGICGTGILFETLFTLSKKIHPHLPDRFSEGYGLNSQSITKLKKDHPDLGVIVTVDNGIKAYEGIKKAKELGIDVIISDHHQRGKENPKSFASIYTRLIGGAEIAWILAREINQKLQNSKTSKLKYGSGLELAALGTIADMLPLLGPNRSFAWHGIRDLRITVRPGLKALYQQVGIFPEEIGCYEVGYIISPRLNAAGRLDTALDALRLICTTSLTRARDLATHLGKVNTDRQTTQSKMVLHAKALLGEDFSKKVIVIAHESYHEGVVGLVAAKLVEEYGLPAVVLSRGPEISKGSARGVSGYDLESALLRVENLLVNWGGHKAAAGLTIQTANIDKFARELNKVSKPLLTDEVLSKKIKIDLELSFGLITKGLWQKIHQFEPTGIGNYEPVFSSKKARVVEGRVVGRDGKHMRLRLKKDGVELEAIGFGLSSVLPQIYPGREIDIAFSLFNSVWRGKETLELKLKDVKILPDK